ncbi:MAG: hypothetical protein B7Z01_00700 [Brevundimonas subvibrioides]|uniref:Anti-sigma factor n=1 Tax=Brevundimonas subvibrioides TaxID=74313 RepID=A0A258FVI9_9CAUL|nr:MAG: hypothetical protein B7Z01_00700 [Brevundimonas subvibrioides]
MTRYDDEILMRRIDGELTPEDGERIDAKALTDAELAGRLRAMRALRTAAREAFEVRRDSRDVSLARLIAGADGERASPWAGLGRALAGAFAPKRAALWGGLAVATFVGGVLAGPLLRGPEPAFTLAPRGEIADSGLRRVLDTRLASEGPDAEGRAVALTYRDADGAWCRTFNAADAGVAGLACRDKGRWAIRVVAPLNDASGEIRTAGSDIPAAILAAVDASLGGETLDAAAEARARDADWR